jgi:dolichyl-phosphate beta-glucosyltransferase
MKDPAAGGTVAISVVIPAYNEETRLRDTLPRIVEYLSARGESFEILVVDDGSSDGTARVADEQARPEIRVLLLGSNRGKGAAARAGVLASRGSRVLLTDADLSTPIFELEKLEPLLAEAPVVIGSRASAEASIERRQAIHRRLMGKAFNRILHLLGLCTDFADTQCGFKLIEGQTARRLFTEIRIEGFAYDMELLELALMHGLQIREVGVLWINSPASRVRLIADSLFMLRDSIGLWWRLRPLRRRLRSRPRRD